MVTNLSYLNIYWTELAQIFQKCVKLNLVHIIVQPGRDLAEFFVKTIFPHGRVVFTLPPSEIGFPVDTLILQRY